MVISVNSEPFTLRKVISGGQTGVDQAALRAARACGLETGGTAPKGYRTETGSAPILVNFGLIVSDSPSYSFRTRVNVRNSVGTLWLGDPRTPGGRLTLNIATELLKPTVTIRFSGDDFSPATIEGLVHWIRQNEIHTLNVAGNRESSFSGIGSWAERNLIKVFEREQKI